ncbi:hypothetical protein C8F01DRAFT_1104688 [Mycena amicta]|nr:hypothetical protein C8F01DRAFT_1104688 [Mycena amicta]
MASLLERMNMAVPGGKVGPVRSKTGAGNRTASPYNRAPKGDVDSAWSHDLFDQHNSLSARMNITPTAPRANLSNPMLGRALQAATGSGLSIKGASAASQGNVVEVTGLVNGTTPEDVAAIFKRCGEIIKATAVGGKEVTIRVIFKTSSAAAAAVQKFHNQPADGKTLSVRIVGTNATSLGGRLGGPDGTGVDVLMESGDGGSKMRSDSLTADPRAQVLAPANRGGVWRGRGRGGRHRGSKRGGKMDVD